MERNRKWVIMKTQGPRRGAGKGHEAGERWEALRGVVEVRDELVIPRRERHL